MKFIKGGKFNGDMKKEISIWYAPGDNTLVLNFPPKLDVAIPITKRQARDLFLTLADFLKENGPKLTTYDKEDLIEWLDN